jgi:hypothetical protein
VGAASRRSISSLIEGKATSRCFSSHPWISPCSSQSDADKTLIIPQPQVLYFLDLQQQEQSHLPLLRISDPFFASFLKDPSHHHFLFLTRVLLAMNSSHRSSLKYSNQVLFHFLREAQKWWKQNPPPSRNFFRTEGNIMPSCKKEWIPLRSAACTALQIAQPPSANALAKVLRVNHRPCAGPDCFFSSSLLRFKGRIRVEIAVGVRPVQIEAVTPKDRLILAEPLPGHDSATRPACQESSAAPGYMVGTAVSVNSFTVDNNLSTAKTRSEVNGF